MKMKERTSINGFNKDVTTGLMSEGPNNVLILCGTRTFARKWLMWIQKTKINSTAACALPNAFLNHHLSSSWWCWSRTSSRNHQPKVHVILKKQPDEHTARIRQHAMVCFADLLQSIDQISSACLTTWWETHASLLEAHVAAEAC